MVDHVLEVMDKKPAPQDNRPFWKRLVSSVNVYFKAKYSNGKTAIEAGIKGGTDF